MFVFPGQILYITQWKYSAWHLVRDLFVCSPQGVPRACTAHHHWPDSTSWGPTHWNDTSLRHPLSTQPNHLGLPWLQDHNPQISWREKQIIRWDSTCYSKCLKPTTLIPAKTTTTTHKLNTAPHVPPEYADLMEVFSKTKAPQLPPHRPSDCAIELLPDTTPPRGRLFPLSEPEANAMKSYIEEELAKGFIRPSTSPAAAGFFFVGKKEGVFVPALIIVV